ncbi:MAG: hypothetical protein IJH40_01965 [Ruminococcus sp.]|uniref:hypothetical protein n=1 Tax=Ruminococcus sp. TaxID=41978 RepID=UPI0028739A0E|nr:hypothetical protein [Ruminococcus sp.]MBQ3284383.1 hypothetical protein [Ruminococcus sp.]
MKNGSEKLKGLFDFVTRHKFLTALILCALFSFVYIAANGFMITSANDDFCVFMAVYGGDTAVPCLGYFYTAFCALIQPLFGVINVYMTLQEIICFFSLTAINYFFLSKLGAKRGLFYTAVFDVLFLSFLIVEIMYTYSAVLASTAGLLCLFYGALYEKRKKVRIFQIICGFFLLFIGSQFRFSPFLACIGIGAVFAVGVLFSRIAKRRKSDGIKRSVASVLKQYVVTGILLIAAVVSAAGLNAVSDAIKNSSDDYRELSTYYEALSAVNDAKAYPYYKNPEKYGEIGLKSAEDISTLRKWFVDDDFYTVERLDEMSELIRDENDDGLLNKSIPEQILYPFKDSFSQMINNKSIVFYLFALVIALFGVIILSILFPKIKWLLIRLFILAFLWSLYFIVGNLFNIHSILLTPLAVLSLLLILRYDRFQAIITLLIVAGLLIPYAYLVSIRLYLYVLLAPVFPAYVMMIFGLDSDNRIELKRDVKFSKIALSVLAVAVAFVSVFIGVRINKEYVRTYDRECNPPMAEYITTHPDTVFLVNQAMLMKGYYNPFILPGENSNVVNYGLWLTKAKCFKDAQKNNGIEHLFKDAIDSNMRIIVWEENVPDGEETYEVSIRNLAGYYNNHYAEDAEVINIKRTDRVGHYSLYAVVSEPASAE